MCFPGIPASLHLFFLLQFFVSLFSFLGEKSFVFEGDNFIFFVFFNISVKHLKTGAPSIGEGIEKPMWTTETGNNDEDTKKEDIKNRVATQLSPAFFAPVNAISFGGGVFLAAPGRWNEWRCLKAAALRAKSLSPLFSPNSSSLK